MRHVFFWVVSDGLYLHGRSVLTCTVMTGRNHRRLRRPLRLWLCSSPLTGSPPYHLTTFLGRRSVLHSMGHFRASDHDLTVGAGSSLQGPRY
jgi:hypothetical protein